MNAPVKQMAASAQVRWSAQIAAIRQEGAGWQIAEEQFDCAVIATPAEQAAPLLAPWEAGFAAKAARTTSAPCWTVMAAFAEPLPFGADVLRAEGPIGWAARNSAKPGRSGPESWVVQAGPDWSRAHLEESPGDIVAPLLRALAEPPPLTGLKLSEESLDETALRQLAGDEVPEDRSHFHQQRVGFRPPRNRQQREDAAAHGATAREQKHR